MQSSSEQNLPVKNIDLLKYSGKWYSLSSIPTLLDKNWRETIENYRMNADGYYEVVTTYRKKGNEKLHSIGSKLFPGKAGERGEMKAQFFWPFKAGYRIIELGTDYSYTVVGHPEKRHLFIMSRMPTMNKSLYEAIVQRCKNMGYTVDSLVLQGHQPGIIG